MKISLGPCLNMLGHFANLIGKPYLKLSKAN